MSGAGIELVDLVARWIHVIAAIMWAGNSMLFNWLDRNLRPASPDTLGSPGAKGTLGNIWLLHSGAFYFVEKTLLGGQPLPRPLHWFFVQAYTTWWSGVTLLVAVYYFGGRAALADASVAPLSHGTAVLVAVTAIVGGGALYESMQRLVAPRAPRVALAIWITGLAAIAIALTQLLSGRAAFLHVGAMLGTIMAANVAFTIVPSQRELVASVTEGRGADPAVSAKLDRIERGREGGKDQRASLPFELSWFGEVNFAPESVDQRTIFQVGLQLIQRDEAGSDPIGVVIVESCNLEYALAHLVFAFQR